MKAFQEVNSLIKSHLVYLVFKMAELTSWLSLLVLVFISTGSADAAQCHDGWMYHNGFCYGFGQAAVSWADALEFCRAYGGFLAEIESADENNFVQTFLKNKAVNQTWIGGTDMLGEGQWEWISSGNTFSAYTNWAAFQPDNYQSGEDCLMYASFNSYKWNDYTCSEKANFLCEVESVSSRK